MTVTYAPLSTTDGIVQATVAPAPATTPLLVGIAILSFSIIPIAASVYRLAFKFACGPRCAVSAKVCAPHADDEANGHQLADENESDRDTLTFLTSPRRLPGRITVHGKYAEGALAGFRFCTWRDARSSSDVSTAAVMKTFNEGLLHAKDWLHEILMYNMYHLQHPAVLRMLEAGLLGTGDVGNRMWTIFERCTHGNLRDLLLRSGCVQTQEMLRILHSIASGLHYLHSSSPPGTNSTGEFKPSIAHCHLATYNVFVRRDGSACIGNLCSSVPKSAHGTESQVGGVAKTTANYFIPVVGSPRYASPEMLSMWVDAYEDFDILLASDIYSFSLIMWEILVMCPVGQASNISPYCKVYSDVTGQKPSLRDMQYHVVELRGRPVLDPTWTENKHHRDITDLMRSCWHTNYRCRLTAGAVLARLEKLVEQLQRTTQHGGQGSNDGGEPSRHYENVDASALTFALGSQDAGEKPAYSSSSSLPSDCERYSQDPLAIAGGASSHLSSSSSASCSSHWPVVTRVDLSGGGGGRLPLVRECHIEGQDADGYCPMKSIPD